MIINTVKKFVGKIGTNPNITVLARCFATAFALSFAPGAAAVSTSCATPDANTPVITTCFFDLTASPSSTESPKSAVLNGGMFRVPAKDGELGKGFIVGTGVFQPFVRIQERGNGSDLHSNGIETGYNTDGRDGVGYPAMVELDNHDKGASNWNHSVRLGDVAKVTVCDGGGTTGSNCKQYYEFLLDTNEQGNDINKGISLDEFKVFTAASGGIHDFTGFDDTKGLTNFQLTGADLRYDMDAGGSTDPLLPGNPCMNPLGCGGDASILMDYKNFSGSGNGVDLQALVPVDNFAGLADDTFLYLYSKFGWTGTQCQQNNNQDSPCLEPDGTTGVGRSISPKNAKTPAGSLDFSVDAGFEEWSFRKATAQVPLPSTVLLFAICFAGALCTRRSAAKRAAALAR